MERTSAAARTRVKIRQCALRTIASEEGRTAELPKVRPANASERPGCQERLGRVDGDLLEDFHNEQMAVSRDNGMRVSADWALKHTIIIGIVGHGRERDRWRDHSTDSRPLSDDQFGRVGVDNGIWRSGLLRVLPRGRAK